MPNKKLMQKNQSYGLEKQASALLFCIAWRYEPRRTDGDQHRPLQG